MNSTIGVVTDSHSSITQKEAEKLGIYVLPMPFYIDDTCYYEDINLTREEFFEKMKAGSHVSTSQPGPEEVMKIWEKALKEHEQILYIPLSSALSGSCQTAQMLAQEEPYAGRVFVVDNGRVSATQHRSVLDALELIEEGYTAVQIRQMLEEARAKNTIYIGVQDLEYLKRGGRISRATAALGSVLNIKPVLQFDVGTLDTYKKCRGFVQAKKVMIDAMKQEFATKFKEEVQQGEAYLLAATSATAEESEKWLEDIKRAFPEMTVLYDKLSLGVSCHIGPGGLGIGCSCRPKRIIR